MLATLLVLIAASAPAASCPAFLRQIVAETALAQVAAPDPAWHPQQRDCAGLVRFCYRAAFLRLDPAEVDAGLWRDRLGRPAAFADAETLLRRSFILLGRDGAARARLESGDLLAFIQGADEGEPVYHLMLVVSPRDPAHAALRVVYHPGARDAAVRFGTLDALASEAPSEWRPLPDNPAFLGFFRYQEWM